ncbi:hypothetical protein VP01_1873g1 [Puccinia sorghi]|uniref:Uncharacterized protein n=1 Tax=Puccinia sorghi TaxID=27349 RepID=A0A0L6VD68_9BASI|nr:hypothetical protein VP01_1873g1 [Puccinia sorghi]
MLRKFYCDIIFLIKWNSNRVTHNLTACHPACFDMEFVMVWCFDKDLLLKQCKEKHNFHIELLNGKFEKFFDADLAFAFSGKDAVAGFVLNTQFIINFFLLVRGFSHEIACQNVHGSSNLTLLQYLERLNGSNRFKFFSFPSMINFLNLKFFEFKILPFQISLPNSPLGSNLEFLRLDITATGFPIGLKNFRGIETPLNSSCGDLLLTLWSIFIYTDFNPLLDSLRILLPICILHTNFHPFLFIILLFIIFYAPPILIHFKFDFILLCSTTLGSSPPAHNSLNRNDLNPWLKHLLPNTFHTTFSIKIIIPQLPHCGNFLQEGVDFIININIRADKLLLQGVLLMGLKELVEIKWTRLKSRVGQVQRIKTRRAEQVKSQHISFIITHPWIPTSVQSPLSSTSNQTSRRPLLKKSTITLKPEHPSTQHLIPETMPESRFQNDDNVFWIMVTELPKSELSSSSKWRILGLGKEKLIWKQCKWQRQTVVIPIKSKFISSNGLELNWARYPNGRMLPFLIYR